MRGGSRQDILWPRITERNTDLILERHIDPARRVKECGSAAAGYVSTIRADHPHALVSRRIANSASIGKTLHVNVRLSTERVGDRLSSRRRSSRISEGRGAAHRRGRAPRRVGVKSGRATTRTIGTYTWSGSDVRSRVGWGSESGGSRLDRDQAPEGLRDGFYLGICQWLTVVPGV